MTPSDLLMTLIDRRVHLQVVDDRLVYTAPHGTMTAELVEELREHKPEVIALLARRTCATCRSAGRCERRVPMEGGGWTCQAVLDAGLLSDSESEADHRQRDAPSGQPAKLRAWISGKVSGAYQPAAEGSRQPPASPHPPTNPEQARTAFDTPNAGCGERVPVRTADGLVWVRCTGPETCDGVCTRAERGMGAAS